MRWGSINFFTFYLFFILFFSFPIYFTSFFFSACSIRSTYFFFCTQQSTIMGYKKRRAHASASRTGSQSGSTADDQSFDADTSDFSVPSVSQLDSEAPDIQQKIQQNVHDVKILRSPTFGALSREESRNNSVIGSIIDEELGSVSGANSGESRSASVITNDGVRIYDVQDMIDALDRPRNKINTESRLFLLGEGYKMLIRHPDTVEVNEQDMDSLIGFIRSAKSDSESLLAIRFACAYAATDSDEVGTQVMDELVPILYRVVFDFNQSNLLRSSCIIAYFSLLLVIFDGSDCYSISDSANDFLELIEPYESSPPATSTDDESKYAWDLVANSINGIGIVLSLLYKGGKNDVNDLIQDFLPRIIPFLGDEFPKAVHKAACILVGLMYEIYDFKSAGDAGGEPSDGQNIGENMDDGPYYDISEIEESINQLVRDSNKKVGKRSKKEVRSIYREVLSTVIGAQEKAAREKQGLAENSDSEENEKNRLDRKTAVISKFAISKTKQLPIRSWFAFLRLIHLKYLFDTELSRHLLGSREVRDFLVGPQDRAGFAGHADDDYDQHKSSGRNWRNRDVKLNGIKKEQQIQRARDDKLREKMDDLNI
ncbi:DEBR0S1_33672g1_1 [Brettanomyces bruxellensis]|uniref:DEBR0S1_33672g1_1 n=2 Tax=Dekkera bruxellensis TaxID=5007 RepID=A0A7D9GY84_DEKBR|nr:DEBR0S1_33672g1_1 [Brettanomyces bruxellensis]